MNKTFDGHTPNENSLLDLDRSDTHIHNIETKRCKFNNDSATYLWHCRLGHIGVKRMKKLHADGLFGFNIMIMCITTIEIQRTIFIGCVTI